ncbi:MAG: hypothetical protein FJZ00_13395 [Candidatus Sericytochromatia bacterium]|uniref:Uncharacterized protein n=1 Tax=Candidatus Tanganyikabacteria bacterium TaxID=2961651 RepID=A0A937X7G0_9BACT|nr:hypothetical protein [Candidatus Tanganyikabacteria bacterium]
MPNPDTNSRSVMRVAAPTAIAFLAIGFMVGCPGSPPAPVVTPAPDTGGGPTPTPPPATGTAKPTIKPTLQPTPPTVLNTPKPVIATPKATATPPPTDLFKTPTPGPTIKPTPALEPLGILLDQGATSSSPFALNQFRIRYGNDNRLTPDLPSTRNYSAMLLLGLGKTVAAANGFQEGIYATASANVNWTISDATILHTNAATGTLDPKDLVWFKVGGAKAKAFTGKSVTIEVATISPGILLTLTASVSIATDSTFVDNGAKAGSVEILASSEGKVEFVISSLGRRFDHSARLVP